MQRRESRAILRAMEREDVELRELIARYRYQVRRRGLAHATTQAKPERLAALAAIQARTGWSRIRAGYALAAVVADWWQTWD